MESGLASEDPAALRDQQPGALHRSMATEHRRRDPGLWLDLHGLSQRVRPAVEPGLASEAPATVRAQWPGTLYRGVATEHRRRDPGLRLDVSGLSQRVRP